MRTYNIIATTTDNDDNIIEVAKIVRQYSAYEVIAIRDLFACINEKSEYVNLEIQEL